MQKMLEVCEVRAVRDIDSELIPCDIHIELICSAYGKSQKKVVITSPSYVVQSERVLIPLLKKAMRTLCRLAKQLNISYTDIYNATKTVWDESDELNTYILSKEHVWMR